MENNKNIIQKVANIDQNQDARKDAQKYNLNIMKVTWKDTGRDKNSCWGITFHI